MLFDPNQWQKLDANKPVNPGPDVHVKLEKPGSLFAVVGKNKVLVGHGHDFKFKTTSETAFVADTPGVFFQRSGASVSNTGPILTNMEKIPQPSALEMVVNREMRKVRQERRKLLAEIAAKNRVAEAEARPRVPPPPEETEAAPQDAEPVPPQETPAE
jgi:hypothetical protein